MNYQDAALARAPEIARFDPGLIGLFMGYDFHLAPTGPKLIEINTNAGGALINAYLLQAQKACCLDMAAPVARFNITVLIDRFMAAFQAEWRRQGRTTPLRLIAIIDETPKAQYLYPEFVLFQRLFEARGLTAVIAAPEQLERRNGGLYVGDAAIDFVYNRLTDFSLVQPSSSALRQAYLAGEVAVSPNPRAHALFANKKNLALLTDAALLQQWGVPTSRLLKPHARYWKMSATRR